jgi:Fe-Mn family superoxide dismutase
MMDVPGSLSVSPRQYAEPGTMTVRPLLLKPQWMNGLSERLLVSHYVNNYGGALRRLNAIRARLAALDWAHMPVFEINGLKREELIAAGSVILHEVYFDSLGGHGDNPPTGLTEPPPGLAQALERDFGSILAWSAEFTAMAKALAGGSGWVILTWSERLGRLVNQWAPDHAHSLPGATPILALDMYEHAYHLNFGARAAAYVDQIMANLNWERIGARYRRAVGDGAEDDKLFLPYGAPVQEEARISAEELKAALDHDDDRRPILVDLCLPRDLPRRTDMLAGASLHAPAALPRWVEQLPRDQPIAVYCICGFQVSGTAVTELRQRGYDARALVGVPSPPPSARRSCAQSASTAPGSSHASAAADRHGPARHQVPRHKPQIGLHPPRSIPRPFRSPDPDEDAFQYYALPLMAI